MPNFADGYVLGEGEPVNRIEQALLRMKMATLLPVLQPETRARLREVANDGLAALDELRLVLERVDEPQQDLGICPSCGEPVELAERHQCWGTGSE